MTVHVRQEGESVLVDGADLKRTARNLHRLLSGPDAAKVTDLSSAMSLLARALGFPTLHACMETAKRAPATIPASSPGDPTGAAGWLRVAQDGPESLQPLFVLGSSHPAYPARYRALFGEEAVHARIATALQEAHSVGPEAPPGLIAEKVRQPPLAERLQKGIRARRDAGAGFVGLVGPAGSGKTTIVASSPKAEKHEWLVVNCLDAHSVTQLELVLRNRLRGVQCIFLDELFHQRSLIKPSLVRQYAENLGATVLAVMAQSYEQMRDLARAPEPNGEFVELEIVYVDGPQVIFESERDRLRFREAQDPAPTKSRRRP